MKGMSLGTGSLRKCYQFSSTTLRRRMRTSVAIPVSNPIEDFAAYIRPHASLPNADPLSDTQTARLIREQAPYIVGTYAKPPPVFHKGEGCYIWDIENRRYLDFAAGIAVNSLGHCDPQIVKVIEDQAKTLMHCSNLYHNPWSGELSKLLINLTRQSGGMADVARVFICNSGSEANEAALKFCRKSGRKIDPTGSKHEIVSFHNSFHGRTLGSLSATPNEKYQKPFSPMIPGFRYGSINASHTLDIINSKTCGVIIEPIQGEGGVHEVSPEFLAALRRKCDEHQALLIFDEIQCGLSRTGKFWAHGFLPKTSHPDILTTAKALGNGFPVGATLVTEAVANTIDTGDHGTTFGGNPLAARVAHHVISRLADPKLQRSVQSKELLLKEGLKGLGDRYPGFITQIRGRGLMLGIQLRNDAGEVVTAARERGLLIITAGKETLRIVPPLTISRAEIQEGLKILGEAFGAVLNDIKIDSTEGQQEMG